MTKRMTSRRVRFWCWVALFGGYSVAVAGVVVDAVGSHYRGLSQVETTTVDATEAQRQLGAAQIAALHRAQSDTPFRTLPAGETFRVVWPDGSSEVVRIVSQSDAHGARPVEGDVLPLGPIELEVQPVSTDAPRRDPSWMAESIGR